jgi:hypothetical protein
VSLYGHADFDRPLATDAGTIFYPFGGGPFLLAPVRCRVADRDDGQIDFRLDLIRSASPVSGESHAVLELRLTADHAAERALGQLRATHPRAVLSPCVLTNWAFRLAPGDAPGDLPRELLDPVPLASNGLGAARMLMRLSVESGLLLEGLLRADDAPLIATAEADLTGVSPRVGAVVRFRAPRLVRALASLAPGGRPSRQDVVNYFAADPPSLPLELSGQVGARPAAAFGEAMADRVIDRFGTYVVGGDWASGPQVQFKPAEAVEDSDITWSLSQPAPATRRTRLQFDLLAEVRRQVRARGIDSVVFRSTATAPALGRSTVTVFCNLPTQRVGVAAIGATLTFPPNPPARPRAKSVTVEFESPADLADVPVQLSPGEPLAYTYSTFAVVADARGSREVRRPEVAHSGSPLRLSPEHFPLDFVLVEVLGGLAALASVSGTCRYDRDGQSFEVPFTLDGGRLSASLALPEGATAPSVRCTAQARDGGGTLTAGPFESRTLSLDLSSFPEYGSHVAEIVCEFDGGPSVFAIDVAPAGGGENNGDVTILAFTPDQPTRRYAWFARSPFRGGFRYRPHRDDGAPGGWVEVPTPVERLTVRPVRPGSAPERAAVAASETVAPPPTVVTRVSEVGRAASEAAPISPGAEPTDQLRYTDPDDLTRAMYVPRYSIALETVSGQQRYRVLMAAQGAAWTLTVYMVTAPAQPLADSVRAGDEVPHAAAVSLNFLVQPPAGARKTLAFTELTQTGTTVVAVLRLGTLQERDEVYRALTEPARDTQLVVNRIIDVAVPPPTQSPPISPPTGGGTGDDFHPGSGPIGRPKIIKLPPRLPPRPILVHPPIRLQETSSLLVARAVTFRPLNLFAVRGGGVVPPRALPTPVLAVTGRKVNPAVPDGPAVFGLSITNWAEFPPEYFEPAPDLPPCGANTNASRTWLDIFDADTKQRLYGYCALSVPEMMAKLSLSVTALQDPPTHLYVTLTDRRANVVRTSNVVDTRTPQPPAVPLQVVHKELPQVVEPTPLTFLPALHGYVFQGIVPGGAGGGLVRHRRTWKGTFHTYLQDAVRRHVVYYLPDRFKLARRREAPFTAFATVRVSSPGGSTQDVEVVFDYLVAPWSDPKRLADARAGLAADPAFAGAAPIQFEPFVTTDVRYFTDRPTQHGTVREERAGAGQVLQGALKDTLVMTLPDFQLLFDAMHRNTAALFLGRVEIGVPGATPEAIPFSARMDDLEGELFLYTATATATEVRVTLTNAIESPVRIDALTATVGPAGRAVPATVQGVPFPVESLAPGASIQVTVTTQPPQAPAGTPEVAFDLAAVAVKVDPAAVWDSILDRSTLEYFDVITVKAIPNLFEPIDGRPGDQIVVILVEFEGGGTAELKAGQVEARVRIDYPIDDVILRRVVDSSYRYRVTVVRADGRQQVDPELRQQTARIFFVNVVK